VATAQIGRFALLDTACAGTYIRRGALAVGPSGIDVPRRFTEELDRVKNHIARLMAASTPNKSALQRLENDTAAGRFIKGLSSATADSTPVNLGVCQLTQAKAWGIPQAASEISSLSHHHRPHLSTKARSFSPASQQDRPGLFANFI
jgi:hypothetical protein